LETRTYKVSTTRGLHVYFAGTRRSVDLIIGGKKLGDIKGEGAHVLAAGSVHPSGKRYEVLDDSPVQPMPAAIAALLSESRSAAKQPISASSSGPPIPYGEHYSELFRMASGWRGKGHDQRQIELLTVDACELRCIDYGDDYRVMCRDIAASVMRYAPNVQGEKACAFPGVSPQRIECTRCHEPQEPAQIKWHPIVYVRGINEQPLCLVCHEEIKLMNFTFLNAKPTRGKLLDDQRWIVWQAFISIPKRSFLSAAIEDQQKYIRSLCDITSRLEELASGLMAG